MKYVIEQEKILVIDDFHYIPSEIQQYIARTLKSELFDGLKAVLLTLPHRSDDAIRLNADLIGRTTVIEIAPWQQEELREIAEKGFSMLALNVDAQRMDMLARESAASPQLMQENCLSLAVELVEEGRQEAEKQDIRIALQNTAENYSYYEGPLNIALRGPTQGRKKRKHYLLSNGEEVDGYSLLLLSIAKDPPKLSFFVQDIKDRMTGLLKDGDSVHWSTLYVSNAVQHIEKSLRRLLPSLDTMEWKDNTLYILDPFLLFYLRWHQS